MKTLFICLLSLFNTLAFAAFVGNQFTYQGELSINNQPLNGAYDFRVELWSQETAGTLYGQPLIFENIAVNQGVFNLALDYSDLPFDGEDWYLSFWVRAHNSGTDFTQLSPKQRINAVPYAIQAHYLDDLGASNGDFLRFNGNDWVPDDINFNSYWNQNGSTYYNNSGDIAIGQNNAQSTKLLVRSNNGQNPLLVKVGTLTKLSAQSNGGLSVGTNSAAPDNGIHVLGDAIQSHTSRGFVKAAVEFYCGNTITLITQSFNNINNNLFDVSNTTGGMGRCALLTPFITNDLFYTTTVIDNRNDHLSVVCERGTINGSSDSERLVCKGFDADNNSRNVKLMVMFY